MTLNRAPLEVVGLEVAVAIDAHEPEIRAGFVANVCVKLPERCVAELDTTIVKVPRLRATWVAALTLLAPISVMNCSLALDAALPVLDRCRSGRAVVTPAGLDAPVAQMPSLNLHPPPAIAQAEVHATAFPYGA
jgi:hypothetical protein